MVGDWGSLLEFVSSVGFLWVISPKSKVLCYPQPWLRHHKKGKKDGRAYQYEYWTGHTSVTPPLPGRGWAGRGFQGPRPGKPAHG